MRTNTDLPLHEVVLKILFLENTDKAAPMTSENVLWRIDNPEISERHVKEVLDWLVAQKKVELYLGKYSLDRVEFIEQRRHHQEINKNRRGTDISKTNVKKQPHFLIEPQKTDTQKYLKFIFLLCIVLIGYVSYLLFNLQQPLDIIEASNPNTKELSLKKMTTLRKLYTSDDATYTEFSQKAISHSFSRQNKINSELKKRVNKMQSILDSLTKTQQRKITKLQKQLQKNANTSNNMIHLLIWVIGVFVIIIILLYLKKTK